MDVSGQRGGKKKNNGHGGSESKILTEIFDFRIATDNRLDRTLAVSVEDGMNTKD